MASKFLLQRTNERSRRRRRRNFCPVGNEMLPGSKREEEKGGRVQIEMLI